MPVGFCSICKIEKDDTKIDNRYKRKPEDATYKMRKPIEMEENTNFSLQNQITEFKAGLEKITKPS
ncbi:9840_t:CDS:2, partial [Entrophospora sp. SA101]